MPPNIRFSSRFAKRLLSLLFIPFFLILIASIPDSNPLELPPPLSNDEETILDIVRKAREGDETSFTQLYQRYYTDIYKHLLRLVGNHEDAADLAAVTFTRAWRRLPGIHDGRHFRGWLYKIATNVAIDHLRNKKKKFLLWGSADEDPTDEYSVRFEDRIEVEELVRLVLKQVAPAPRACLLLHLEGFSNEEIAMFLGFKEKSVGTYLSTARKQFLRAYRRLRTT
jgi:RNA polymerase sigma-70 factor, ECF subfamily